MERVLFWSWGAEAGKGEWGFLGGLEARLLGSKDLGQAAQGEAQDREGFPCQRILGVAQRIAQKAKASSPSALG